LIGKRGDYLTLSVDLRLRLRENFTTDNGNLILDVHGLTIMNPVALEETLNQLPGVVTNGLFARRPADVLLLGTDEGVKETKR